MEKSYKFVKYWNFWKFFSIKKLLDGYGFIRNSRSRYFFFRRSKLGCWEILVKETSYYLGEVENSSVEFEDTETLTNFVEALADGNSVESFFLAEKPALAPAIEKIFIAEDFEKRKKMKKLRKFYNER